MHCPQYQTRTSNIQNSFPAGARHYFYVLLNSLDPIQANVNTHKVETFRRTWSLGPAHLWLAAISIYFHFPYSGSRNKADDLLMMAQA